jgi:hypothetical protein
MASDVTRFKARRARPAFNAAESRLPHQRQQTAGIHRAAAVGSGPANATVTPKRPNTAQFRLIKQWLHYIRLFLPVRRNQGSKTVV